jgi:ketosteroid isomerase-like protein
MLKKNFLPCLAAALILPFPWSVIAAPVNLSTQKNREISSQSLSKADINSIKKEVDSLLKATNERNSKKYLSHYSKNYVEYKKDGVISYYTIAKNAKNRLNSLPLSFKLAPIEIDFGSLRDEKINVLIRCKTEAKDAQDSEHKMGLVFEKVQGRWLIVTEENTLFAHIKLDLADIDKKPRSVVSDRDRQKISDLFKRHLDALNHKDLNSYLATLQRQSQHYDNAKIETAKLLKEYTLKYTLKSVKIISMDLRETVVETVATVQKVSGGGFKDSKIKTTNILHKEDGKWYIFETSIDSVTELVAKK